MHKPNQFRAKDFLFLGTWSRIHFSYVELRVQKAPCKK